MEKNTLLQYITCPLTKLIFCDPVLAEDGNFYELMAIREYLKKNSTSPITGEKIGDIVIRANLLKQMVTEFLSLNTEYKTDQFLFKKPYYLFSQEFLNFLNNKEYEKLKEFTNIILNTDINKETLFELICKTCPDDIIHYIIDNSIDYDMYNNKKKIKPIHTVCALASTEVIMHLVDKKICLESEDANGERPLGYIIIYRNNEIQNKILPFLFNVGIDINYVNKTGNTPVHHIISSGNLEILKMFVAKGLNLANASQKIGGVNILQYSLKESPNPNLISYLINLNTNLDIDIDIRTPSEQLIYLNKNLEKKQKQQLVLQYLTKLLYKPVVVDDFMDSVHNKL